ncbi:hypothetical protein DCC39_04705 [Pueribacillus theae]|uniref:Uncharacterized protein n=1 Tax=Pueribacillus theae TaxID=2171751 RepID=A0A2U1K6F0_9BACI|nr:hypothetical protein [Pueribacillus theae]PWA12739.1 hypothetical protein DCC39_04705 [Pueribacillus theae]
MFESTFQKELARRAGAQAEIATNTNLIDGLMLQIGPIVIVVQNTGYGINITISISLGAINFVRFPAAA